MVFLNLIWEVGLNTGAMSGRGWVKLALLASQARQAQAGGAQSLVSQLVDLSAFVSRTSPQQVAARCRHLARILPQGLCPNSTHNLHCDNAICRRYCNGAAAISQPLAAALCWRLRLHMVRSLANLHPTMWSFVKSDVLQGRSAASRGQLVSLPQSIAHSSLKFEHPQL